MPFLSRPNARLYYETFGSTGDWITLLNGFSRPWTDFRGMVRHLTERNFRVLALDNRGAGRTELQGDFVFDDLVGDIEALWTEMKITRTDVLGISMGGLLAQLVALRAPKIVRRLILVSTTPTSEYLYSDPIGRLEKGDTETGVFQSYFSKSFLDKNQVFVHALVQEMARAFRDPKTAANARLQQKAIPKYDLTPQLGTLTMPVLVLHGGDDHIVDPKAAEVFRKNLAQAKIQMLPGVGHLLLAEAPQRLYSAVVEFFGDRRRPMP